MPEHRSLPSPAIVGTASLALTASTLLAPPPPTSAASAAAAPPVSVSSAPARTVATIEREPRRVSRDLPSTGKQKNKHRKTRFEARVRIASVGIHRRVYRGAQRMIDRDRVTHYTGWSNTFVAAGRPGVYWLAAHNYGRYGPFHPLVRIKKGATVKVTTRAGKTYTYRVVRRAVVNPWVRFSTVWGDWGPRSGPPRAVLQTCVGSARLLVYANLVPRRR